MGWLMGLEPTTDGTTIRCSTIELQPPFLNGTPERIRTSDPQLRRLLLYPAELQAHIFIWWRHRDLNPGPTDYDSDALTN